LKNEVGARYKTKGKREKGKEKREKKKGNCWFPSSSLGTMKAKL